MCITAWTAELWSNGEERFTQETLRRVAHADSTVPLGFRTKLNLNS
jgi:hypothetical protein